MKKILIFVFLFCFLTIFTACKDNDPDTNKPGKNTDNNSSVSSDDTLDQTDSDGDGTIITVPTATPTPELKWDGAYLEKPAFLAYLVHDFETAYYAIEDQIEETELNDIKNIFEYGRNSIRTSQTVEQAENAYKLALHNLINAIPVAEGTFSFKDAEDKEKENILGILEHYAVYEGLTGITIYEKDQPSGVSCYKLNINTCDEGTWEYLFGKEGIIKITPKNEYWDVKPVLNNSHFIRALSLAIDRVLLANNDEAEAKVDYLPLSFSINDETCGPFSETDIHKKAVNVLLEGTDGYGYSLKRAQDYFRMAMTELEYENAYTPGTNENPTEINIEIAWMLPPDEEEHHEELKRILEDAFNDPDVCKGVYKLNFNFWAGEDASEVYYFKMMTGQYDIGVGSILSNERDTVGLFEILSTDRDISGGLTINWGDDTNSADNFPIVYKGLRWSYDALYSALDQQAFVADGRNKKAFKIDYKGLALNNDGSFTGSFTVKSDTDENPAYNFIKLICCNYDRFYNGDHKYVECELNADIVQDNTGEYTISFTLPNDFVNDVFAGIGAPEKPMGYIGLDLYYEYEFNGNKTERIYSVSDLLLSEQNEEKIKNS